MANVVFILGAGASAQDGCPVMRNFFRRAESLYANGQIRQYEEDYRRVYKFRSTLAGSVARGAVDIDNLESVFSALELRSVLHGQREKQGIRDSFVRLIAGVLEATQRNRISNGKAGTPLIMFVGERHGPKAERSILEGPPAYLRLAQLIHSLTNNNKHAVSCITFNYDIGLEIALSRLSLKYNYYLDGNEAGAASGGQVPVLKLHGSLNWFLSNSGGPARLIASSIDAPWDEKVRSTDPRQSGPIDWQEHFVSRIESQIRSSVPFIVPPTDSKAEHRPKIRAVWQAASRALGSADAIVVAGYSLTATDQFFRLLFALSAPTAKLLQGMWVFDCDPTVEQKYLDMIGPSVQHRFKYVKAYFKEMPDYIDRVCKNWSGELICDGPNEAY